MDACDGRVTARRTARTTYFMAVMFAILAALIVAGGAGPAEAAFPGANGKIAFSKFNPHSEEVRTATVNPDGTGQARLGDGTGYYPAYSADGRKVAFVRASGNTEEDYNEDIWIMDSDGGNPVRLTTGRGFESSPSFSPDGQTVAFVRYGNRGSELYAKRLDGTGATRLTETPDTFEEAPVYSPDGQKISFTAFGRRGSDLWTMNADGTGAQNLTRTRDTDELEPDWSPDGTQIAFTSYRFDFGEPAPGGPATAASQLETLMESGSQVDARGEPGQVQEEIEISVMNADGTNRQDLTDGRDFDVAPAFSPDGSKIAFTKAAVSRREGETADIFVMDADGTGEQRLTDTRAFEYGPDWQPLPQESEQDALARSTAHNAAAAAQVYFAQNESYVGLTAAELDAIDSSLPDTSNAAPFDVYFVSTTYNDFVIVVSHEDGTKRYTATAAGIVESDKP